MTKFLRLTKPRSHAALLKLGQQQLQKPASGCSPSRMDTTMSSWSDLETMVAVGGPQAGSAWGKRDPGETRQARDHQQGSRRVSPRPPTAPDAGTPLRGPGLPPPAARRAPRPRAASPALACPDSRQRQRPLGLSVGRGEPTAGGPFAACVAAFSNARAAAAAAAAPRFRLATRPAGPVPGESWRTKGDRDPGSRG